MLRHAGKTSAHLFPKMFQVEWSGMCCLPRKGNGLSSLEVPVFYSLCFLQLGVTVGSSLNLCLG